MRAVMADFWAASSMWVTILVSVHKSGGHNWNRPSAPEGLGPRETRMLPQRQRQLPPTSERRFCRTQVTPSGWKSKEGPMMQMSKLKGQTVGCPRSTQAQ